MNGDLRTAQTECRANRLIGCCQKGLLVSAGMHLGYDALSGPFINQPLNRVLICVIAADRLDQSSKGRQSLRNFHVEIDR